MPELKARIQEDMKTAMKAQDKLRLNAIRLILAAIKQAEIDEQITADDSQILAILDKMLKQRRDSIIQYQNANRNDLAEKEAFEVQVIRHYMPSPLTDDEIETLIDQAIAATQAKSAQEMGKVMAYLKPLIQGRADAAIVSKQVKQRLG